MDYPYTIYKKKKFWHGDLKHQSSPTKNNNKIQLAKATWDIH